MNIISIESKYIDANDDDLCDICGTFLRVVYETHPYGDGNATEALLMCPNCD